MAYIPPHRRHSKDSEKPSPTPEKLAPKFEKHLNLKSTNFNVPYLDLSIYRWCAVDSDANIQFRFHVDDQLQPISLESIGRKRGRLPLLLVNNHVAKDIHEMKENKPKSPWESIAQTVWPDLLSSYEIISKELEEVKPGLFARFGKILFYRTAPVSVGSIGNDQVDETTLRQVRRSFYTNIPTSYMERVMSEVVPKIGVDFVMEKDVYHVLVSDSTRPNMVVSCKCKIKDDKKLELYKVELNPVRHMVVDISCLDKNLDLRLSLITKRSLMSLSDDEMDGLRNLVSSAALEPKVMGGLKWPLGKECCGDRYRVVGAWHTIVKVYQSPSLRLRIRHADRFDFKTSTGEVTIEIVLRLKRVLSEMKEKKIESDMIYNMFKDDIKLIWDHFLCCERFLK